MTDVPEARWELKYRLQFERNMRDLPDVVSVLGALDDLWVGCYDLEMYQHANQIWAEFGDYEYRELNGARMFGPLYLGNQWGASASSGREDVPRLPSVAISLQSPLMVELAGVLAWPASIGAAAPLFTYILKNPDKVAGFLPGLVAGWHEGWARARRARTDRYRASDELAEYVAERDLVQQAQRIASRTIASAHVLSDASLIVSEAAGDVDGEQIT